MLRTNNKEVKNKIRGYIVNHADFSGYIGYEGFPKSEPEHWAEKVYYLHKIFVSEYGYNIRRMGEYRAFKEWLCGVPSALTVDFCYYDVRKIMREWLDQTEEESARFDDVETWEKFLHLVTREFFALWENVRRSQKKGE